jgi:protoporphyrinogen oxidase
MKEGTYWLNINATVPFGALIEHTNFLPAKDYSGQHILYVAAYFQDPRDPLCADSPEDVLEKFLDGIERLFPDFNRDSILWWRLARDAQTAPVYETGYVDKVLPYKTDIPGLYLAGMFSQANYPERSMNGSIKAGFEVADAIVRDM